jgi:hypothetical protein
VDYEKDVFTYVIGGARVLNDQWTVLGSLTYEAEQDVFSGNLGPTDGRTSIGIGARYTTGQHAHHGRHQLHLDRRGRDAGAEPVPVGTQFSSFTDNRRHRRGPAGRLQLLTAPRCRNVPGPRRIGGAFSLSKAQVPGRAPRPRVIHLTHDANLPLPPKLARHGLLASLWGASFLSIKLGWRSFRS